MKVHAVFVFVFALGVATQAIDAESQLAGLQNDVLSNYHIYRGNTHAHTIFTASEGEHQKKKKKPADGKAESTLQIDSEGVQRPAKGMVRKPDWRKSQGEPADHFARAKTNGYDF